MPIHGKNCRLWFGALDLSAYFNEATVSQKADVADSTTFGAGAHTYVMGNEGGSVALKGLFDSSLTAADTYFTGVLGADADFIATQCSAGLTTGARASLMAVQETDYEVTAPTNDIVAIAATLQADGPIDAGVLLAGNIAYAVTTNGTSVDNAVATSNGGVAHLHVPANTSNGATTVKVQHSSDAATWADLVAFTAVATTTTATQRVVVAPGTTVNRYVRAQSTLAGASGSVTVTVAFARR